MGGFVVQHYWSGKDVAFERFNSELNNTDVAWRQQVLAQVSEEKGTLLKLGLNETRRIFGLS